MESRLNDEIREKTILETFSANLKQQIEEEQQGKVCFSIILFSRQINI